MPARLPELTLPQPVFRHRSFETNVVTPAKPRIAFEDVFHLMKRLRRLLMLTRVDAIDSTIDQRVRLRLEHMMTARHLDAIFVVLVRRLEVVKLAINPPDTIRKPRTPEKIAVA